MWRNCAVAYSGSRIYAICYRKDLHKGVTRFLAAYIGGDTDRDKKLGA
jgi:hypothetical protein